MFSYEAILAREIAEAIGEILSDIVEEELRKIEWYSYRTLLRLQGILEDEMYDDTERILQIRCMIQDTMKI